jgi:hypothetical protein
MAVGPRCRHREDDAPGALGVCCLLPLLLLLLLNVACWISEAGAAKGVVGTFSFSLL